MRAVALAMLALLAPAFALPAIAADSQVPPKPEHRVTDTAALISNDTRESVELELRDYESATGHQVIVWIGDTTGDVPLETFTVDAANAWKVGRKGKDDGAILFIFAKDHKARIEVGYGLESSPHRCRRAPDYYRRRYSAHEGQRSRRRRVQRRLGDADDDYAVV